MLGIDDATDIAVIRFDPEGIELQPLELADSSDLKVGASVAAIGAPFEYAWSFSTGIVSGLDRTIEAPNGFTVSHAIQTDAAINPGNSGGPLIDADGEVIGVVDQIATDGSADQSSGVGFAVPSNLVSRRAEQLEAGETVEHAYLGVSTGDRLRRHRRRHRSPKSSRAPRPPKRASGRATSITELDEEQGRRTEDLIAAIAAANRAKRSKPRSRARREEDLAQGDARDPARRIGAALPAYDRAAGAAPAGRTVARWE